MVKRLVLPAIDNGWLVDQLVAERQNGVNAQYFKGIQAEWRQRAKQYSAVQGDPLQVAQWATIEAVKTRFLTLYNNPQVGHVQHSILDSLRDRKLKLCPGCGEEGTPNTLDHYLPKANYPHLAVLPANLFPLCDICQGEKGTETTINGEKIFVHPYFDSVGDSQVYKLIIHHPFNAPHGFTLEPHPALAPPNRDLVRRHMNGLNLEERYGSFFRDEYIRLLKLAHGARGGPLDFAVHLASFKHYHSLRGLNVWPHVFYDGVCNDAALVDYLRQGLLPEDI